MTTNKTNDVGAVTARLYKAQLALDQASCALSDLLNEAYPVGTVLLVRHGNGTTPVTVFARTWPVGARANKLHCRYVNSKKESTKDVSFHDVLEVLDENQ